MTSHEFSPSPVIRITRSCSGIDALDALEGVEVNLLSFSLDSDLHRYLEVEHDGVRLLLAEDQVEYLVLGAAVETTAIV